jgi:hypothetical protein
MNSADTDDFVHRYAQLLTRAWCEESYDDLLSADPRAALAQVGLRVPAGAEVAVVRTGPSPPDLRIQLSLWTDAAGSNRFVLHVPPLDARTLAGDELDNVVGGASLAGTGTVEPVAWSDLLRTLLAVHRR